MEDSVELTVVTPSAGRGPVTTGLPWPRGRLRDPQKLVLRDTSGKPVRLQSRATDRWPDGSVRWVLLDFIAEAGKGPYRVGVGEPVAVEGPAVKVGKHERFFTPRDKPPVTLTTSKVDTGPVLFEVGYWFPFTPPGIDGEIQVTPPQVPVFYLGGRLLECEAVILATEVEEAGPLRTCLHLKGYFSTAYEPETPFADFEARLHFFAGSAAVRVELTIRNSRRAAHPGGLWDLGDAGSIDIRAAPLTFGVPYDDSPAVVRCSPEIGAPVEEFAMPFELYQDSSGGENWHSTNHLDRTREITTKFRGYRLKSGVSSSPSPLEGEGKPGASPGAGEGYVTPSESLHPSPGGEAPPPSPLEGEGENKYTERTGLRATPLVTLAQGRAAVGVAVPQFWQNFPQAVTVAQNALTLDLLPTHSAAFHELQGGEQKTWTFAVAFGPDATPEALEWFRSPAKAFASPKWYCDSGAIPYLTPKADDSNTDYLKLVDAAIEGPDTFDAKRERIDEFGWRHFGDIYGDHEAVYHTGPQPMVSHYNNQYDAIAGFAYQFLRSGKLTWLRHMDELAQHVIDIDIYHTTQDKSAYNGGLFWHTYHYADADTGTHRSYPKSLQQMKSMPGLDPNSPQAQRSKHLYARGGGPADEHNYTTGLMLHHFLTGSMQSREAALWLAQWVINMDDGRKTVFRWLSTADTGYASQSRDAGYHGPGRGSGNSLNALIDGHRLSGDPAFLAKAEQLVRRCIHPNDNIARRNLLDVENRWFYTIFLQALGKYLDHKAARGELDATYAYARASLLHYARWMADNEVPTLSRPEVLEYPNETWAAQDMRKSEVFKFAAKHATGPQRERFLERSDFFFRDSVSRLTAFETRTLARPVVLMLSYGYTHAYFQKHPEEACPPPATEVKNFGTPTEFVPQKLIAKKRAKLLAAAGTVGGLVGAAGLIAWLLS